MPITWSISRWFAAPWSAEGRATETSPALERWRTLLYWASRSDYYWEYSSTLAEANIQHSLGALRSQLRRIPPVPLTAYQANPERFRSGNSTMPAPQRSASFWEAKARIAVVRPWFRTEDQVTIFNGVEPLSRTARRINRFEPDVIVASPGVLSRLADTVLAPPARAIIAVHAPAMPLMREAGRDALWSRFKVPVFQQLRGFQGELLAAECDAQVGFHAHEPTAHWELHGQELVFTSLVNLRYPTLRLASGWHGDMERSRCGCGCLSPRLFPFEQRAIRRQVTSERRILQLAAGA